MSKLITREIATDLATMVARALQPYEQATRNPNGQLVGEPDWCEEARSLLLRWAEYGPLLRGK